MTKYTGDWRIAEVKGHMVRPEGQQGWGVGGSGEGVLKSTVPE